MDPQLSFDLDALLIFRKVVECRSLTRAAEVMAMTKSTVSRKIARLEADLGVQLLRRNTHQISVTDLGEKVYRHALNILSEANQVRALIEGSKQEPQGLLRVAMPVFVGIDFAARIGALFMERYPRSRIETRLVDDMVHPVKDGFDVVLGVGPLQDSTLIARKLFTLECFLCASRDYLATLDEAITTPAQLNHLPLIDTGVHTAARKLVLTRGRKRQELSPPVRAKANNFQIARQYILQGLGVGVMPKLILCAGDLQEGRLQPVLPDWQLPAVEVHMLYPFQMSYSNLIGAFYDTAREVIEQNIAVGQRQEQRQPPVAP